MIVWFWGVLFRIYAWTSTLATGKRNETTPLPTVMFPSSSISWWNTYHTTRSNHVWELLSVWNSFGGEIISPKFFNFLWEYFWLLIQKYFHGVKQTRRQKRNFLKVLHELKIPSDKTNWLVRVRKKILIFHFRFFSRFFIFCMTFISTSIFVFRFWKYDFDLSEGIIQSSFVILGPQWRNGSGTAQFYLLGSWRPLLLGQRKVRARKWTCTLLKMPRLQKNSSWMFWTTF